MLSKASEHFHRHRNTEREASSEDESSDNDFDEPKTKRVSRALPSRNSNEVLKRDNHWVAESYKAIQQGNRKVNNIWGSVLQEESISSCVKSLLENENIDYTERGCESYDYTRAGLDERPDASESSSSDEEEKAQDVERSIVDLDSLETFATSKVAREKQVVKDERSEKHNGGAAGDAKHQKDLRSLLHRKRKFCKGDLTTAIKPMKPNVKLDGLSNREMAEAMADALNEPKEQLDVIG